VKYGPSGQTISVGLARSDDENSARIWVEDEGPGIPETERGKIWEPFHRLDRDANSAIAGSGIGLALVHNLTLAHGGLVLVDDGANGGSRFTIEIPCAGRSYEPIPIASATLPAAVEPQLVTRR
jgi:signal transduction histidine kinase